MHLSSVFNLMQDPEQLSQLSLVESYFLPLLTYASGALTFTYIHLQELNVCWDTV